jgi:pyruvate,water dikinase
MYGVRTGVGVGSETTLRTPTWREQPELVLQLVAAYVDSSVEDPAAARARARRERDAEVDALCAACGDPDLVAEFRRQLGYVRKDATLLEEHNHYIDQMATGQTRHAILAAGRWLAEQGQLDRQGDVFRLRLEEILTVLRAESTKPGREIVAARRAQYEQWAQLHAPLHLGVPPSRLPDRPPAVETAAEASPEELRRITGKGASPGRRSGRARIVAMSTLVPEVVKGDVLVAENAGPLWTPIFPILSGIVLDQGGVLGHASTMAREYGIPAVVSTRNATQRIPEGAWVTIDGAEGMVEIAEK